MEELKIEHQKIIEEISSFLKKEFGKRNKTRAILGISGGTDSAVVAFLCKRANLDLWPIFMPYTKLSKPEKVKKLVAALNLPNKRFIDIDITKLVDHQQEEIKKKISLDKIDKGNLMARTRMMILYALARKLNGLVVGTENLTEYYLGYFTLHGDQGCDINPLRGLFKIQVMELAKYLGVPEEILREPPSAELYQGQSDEQELGFSYQNADPILYLSFIKKLAPEKIIKDFGANPNLVNRVLERVKVAQYKSQQIPRYEIY